MVERLKKEAKANYRITERTFTLVDVDEHSWGTLFAQQKAHQEELLKFRTLRAQLTDHLQLDPAVLNQCGLRTSYNEFTNQEEFYSSDEEQMYSDADLAEQQELAKDIAIEAGIWIVAPEAKALQLVSKLGKVAKLGKQVTKGGKVLIQLQEKVVGKELSHVVESCGAKVVGKGVKAYKPKSVGKVLQSGGHTLENSTAKALGLTEDQGKKAIEKLKKANNISPNFHGTIMSNGDLIHPHTKELLGNLFHYLP